MPKPTCQMLISVDPVDLECGQKALFVVCGDIYVCQEHLDGMLKEEVLSEQEIADIVPIKSTS